MDFDSIPAGVDFREHIKRALGRAHVVVALIGPNWLGGRTGFRRIDDTDDFVRFEISFALARGIPVIPVLVNDATMPDADELPADLKELAFRNALPLDSGLDFHSHADRLVAALRAIPSVGRHRSRPWRNPAWLIAGILAGVVIAVLTMSGFFSLDPKPAETHERSETKTTPIAAAVSPTPSSSPTVPEREYVPGTAAPSADPSVSPVPLREFRGRWSNTNSSPLGGNGTLTVADQLVIDDKEIRETISTEWVSEGTSVFRITLKVRFGELWTFSNQLNARCLSADVVDMKDPKDFGKYANMKEQTTNAAKAGVGLVYTFTLSGTELRRGGMTWTRQK